MGGRKNMKKTKEVELIGIDNWYDERIKKGGGGKS